LRYFSAHAVKNLGLIRSNWAQDPYRLIGPTGTRDLIENLERAYTADIKIRLADEELPLAGIATDVREFDRDGVVYQHEGLKVIAFEVDHGDVIKPCYGYRFEYAGRVVVLSADTRYNQNVIRYGAGAGLLIQEVASAAGADEGNVTFSVSSRTTRRRATPAASLPRPIRSWRSTHTLSCSAVNELPHRRSKMSSPKPDKATRDRSRWVKT
jgi:ribonuclease Z